MPRITIARREAPLGLTIRTLRKSSNARRFHSPPASSPHRAAAIADFDRGVLAMIYYNNKCGPREPLSRAVSEFKFWWYRPAGSLLPQPIGAWRNLLYQRGG
jgi:hypothetical protein